MIFNRFDIDQAYYKFFVDYHEGINSEKYRRLCKLQKIYYNHNSNLSENAQAIYGNLVTNEFSWYHSKGVKQND